MGAEGREVIAAAQQKLGPLSPRATFRARSTESSEAGSGGMSQPRRVPGWGDARAWKGTGAVANRSTVIVASEGEKRLRRC